MAHALREELKPVQIPNLVVNPALPYVFLCVDINIENVTPDLLSVRSAGDGKMIIGRCDD